jgi:hypothetical protein
MGTTLDSSVRLNWPAPLPRSSSDGVDGSVLFLDAPRVKSGRETIAVSLDIAFPESRCCYCYRWFGGSPPRRPPPWLQSLPLVAGSS